MALELPSLLVLSITNFILKLISNNSIELSHNSILHFYKGMIDKVPVKGTALTVGPA